MKIFVWERVSECTTSYHSEGGVVVVAEHLEEAKNMAKEVDCIIGDDEHPSLTLDVSEESEKRVLIMPDAGCC